MLRLVLASASPARTATLSAAGLVHEVSVSDVDEPAVLAAQARAAADAGEPAPEPVDQVLALACAKAEDVAATIAARPGTSDGESQADGDRFLVLGCDSMLEVDLGDGVEVVGKPEDAATARQRWRAMRGGTGVLHTGHWLVDLPAGTGGPAGDGHGAGSGVGAVSSALIRFAELTDDEIDAYVATGEPLAVAGGFTVDGLGGPFVDGIEGDFHGVVGVSLPLLRDLLGRVGLAVTDLWH
ncbi:MAG: Maf family protein [Actinomycetaceae bacterium]